MKTIEEIYAAINPLPAMLAAKGKAEPKVQIEFEANAGITLWLKWRKPKGNSWELDLKCFLDSDPDIAVAKAMQFIDELPSAEDAKLIEFRTELAKLIDSGRDLGIDLDYINPLVATMKRLSENIITDQSEPVETPPPAPSPTAKDDDDDIPF